MILRNYYEGLIICGCGCVFENSLLESYTEEFKDEILWSPNFIQNTPEGVGKWQDRWNKVNQGLVSVKTEWWVYGPVGCNSTFSCVCVRVCVLHVHNGKLKSKSINACLHTYIYVCIMVWGSFLLHLTCALGDWANEPKDQ